MVFEVEELLRRGAPLRQPNAEGLQAVHLAVRNGQLPGGRGIVVWMAWPRKEEHFPVCLL